MSRKIVSLFVVISFLLACAAVSFAAEKKAVQQVAPAQKAATTVAKPVLTGNCPSGWHKKPGGSANEWSCVPNKPSGFKCPEGYTYFEALECKGSQFFGGIQVSGCEVGCYKPPEPPR